MNRGRFTLPLTPHDCFALISPRDQVFLLVILTQDILKLAILFNYLILSEVLINIVQLFLKEWG